MRGKTKFLVIIAVVAILVAVAAVWKKDHADIKKDEAGQEKIKVTAIKVKEQTITEASYVTATVIPQERVKLASKIMAHVEKIYVREGDSFHRDQLLVRLDQREIVAHSDQARAGLEQALKAVNAAEAALEDVAAAKKAAEASLANAQSTYERTKKLFQVGAATTQDFDNATERFKATKAQMERLEAQEQALLAQREQAMAKVKEAQAGVEAMAIQLSYAAINAPFDGYVVQKLAEEGDLVGPGQPLLIVDRPPWRVEAAVNEKYLQDIHLGDPLKIKVDTLGQEITGRVAEINPAVDPVSRTFKIKIDLPEKNGAKSGMFARVYLPAGLKKGIVLPEEAIIKKYDFSGVYIVDAEGTAHLRYVEPGKKLKDGIEILSGVNPGESVVIKGAESLADGMQVEVDYH